ncbi:hypothetical protein [Dactylococcopsis salina]|nr:hypothetical protein [Dactylococcopsis salina]
MIGAPNSAVTAFRGKTTSRPGICAIALRAPSAALDRIGKEG